MPCKWTRPKKAAKAPKAAEAKGDAPEAKGDTPKGKGKGKGKKPAVAAEQLRRGKEAK